MRNPDIKFEPAERREFLSRDEILRFSPREMVDYLSALEEQGELENFLEKAAEDESLRAHLSYWEKWIEKYQRDLLERIIGRKKEMYPPNSESLPLELEKKFSEKELALIFSNMQAIQLTFGCSMGCVFCGFDAIKGVREHIPYSQLVNMFQRYGKQLSKGKPFLYWASEPSDYVSKGGLEDRTYEDVHNPAVRYAGYDPNITSFNVTDQKWIDFMARRTTEYRTDRRLSVFGMREKQLVGLQMRIFKGYRGAGSSGAGPQRVQLYGRQFRHVKGMGKTYEEQQSTEDIPKAGIACVDGVLLTPRGLFNLFVVPISKEFPQGVIITPLEQITDEPVKPGDELREVMRRSVVEGRFSHEGAISTEDKFQIYTGKFPKKSTVHTSGKRYSVSVDQNGNILDSRVIESDDENLATPDE